MSIRSFLSSCKRLLKLVGRPSREEIWLYIRISVIGIGVLGVMGFVVKFIASMLQAGVPAS